MIVFDPSYERGDDALYVDQSERATGIRQALNLAAIDAESKLPHNTAAACTYYGIFSADLPGATRSWIQIEAHSDRASRLALIADAPRAWCHGCGADVTPFGALSGNTWTYRDLLCNREGHQLEIVSGLTGNVLHECGNHFAPGRHGPVWADSLTL